MEGMSIKNIKIDIQNGGFQVVSVVYIILK